MTEYLATAGGLPRMRFAACILLALAATTPAAAQSAPPTAPDVLANVETYYARAKQLTAQFRQVVTNATFNTTTKSDGSLWVARPDKLRWDYLEQRGKTIRISKSFVFDGKTFWFIDHDSKRIIQSHPQNTTVPAAVSFLTGGRTLSSQFSIALNTTGTYGGPGSVVLELTPKQASAQYAKLLFVVDATSWRVKESIVIDANGDTNAFTFYAPKIGTQIHAKAYQVNPASLPTYVVSSPAAAAPASAPASGSASTTP